mgnify:FL=1
MILTVTLNPAVDYTVFGGAFTPYATNRGRDIAPEAGGKGNNAARVCRLLGFEVIATGIVGGHTGDFIRSAIESEGVVARFLEVPHPTRITMAYIETESGRDTKIVPSGAELDDTIGASFLSHYEALLRANKCDIVLLCGSLPPGLPDDYYGTLIDTAAAHGARVILDTSGAPLTRAIGHDPFIITPNLHEACELAGSDDRKTVIDFLCRASRRMGMAALTLGSEGAVYCVNGTARTVPAPRVKTVNPVGAGDAFAAGLACACAKFGLDPAMMARWSLAAGACTAQSRGLTWDPALFDSMLAAVGDIPVP